MCMCVGVCVYMCVGVCICARVCGSHINKDRIDVITARINHRGEIWPATRTCIMEACLSIINIIYVFVIRCKYFMLLEK